MLKDKSVERADKSFVSTFGGEDISGTMGAMAVGRKSRATDGQVLSRNIKPTP